MDPLRLVQRRFEELTTIELLAILRLRVDVFVVEQDCAYPEIDGLDEQPGTRHVWLDDSARGIASYLRLLEEGDDQRIGRVVTAPWARGRGLAAQLLADVLRQHDHPTVLQAQAHLQELYARHGFRVVGPEVLEDGIPHVPMRRDPDA